MRYERTDDDEMADIQEGEELTGLLSEDEANGSLIVPREWQTTLELTFDRNALGNLQRGIEETFTGRLLTHEEMWAGV